MPNSNFNLQTAVKQGARHSLGLFSSANVTFPFEATSVVSVSFYVVYGGPEPVQMIAEFGPVSTTINVDNHSGWRQVTLPAQGPGSLALTLKTGVLPTTNTNTGSTIDTFILVSNLEIGSDSINLNLWNANQSGPLSAWLSSNYALQLADNSFIISNNAPQFGKGDFTLETWISTAVAGTLFCGTNPRITIQSINALRVCLQPDQTIDFDLRQIGGGAALFSRPTTILDGDWHHVAVTRSQTTMCIYFDGDLVGTKPWSVPIDLDGMQDLYCCAGLSGPSRTGYLAATLDEMRFWNRALSQQEINLGLHHQLTDQELGLIGHFTFDDQDLSDYSPADLQFSPQGNVQYVPSELDFEPAGEPYLVTQAQLMQDYVQDSTGAFAEISGYRVVIQAHDTDGNPTVTNITIWAADADSTAELIFMDGTSASVTADNSWSGSTDRQGELTFVIDAQGSLICPVLKVNAAFMAAGTRLVISPDRHVHATLASVTGEQLAGAEPLPSGKKAALGNIGGASSVQLSAVATAISHVMSTAVDHNLQPNRPVTRTRDLPEDVELAISAAPRYKSLAAIVAPYDFVSNAISTHFLPTDLPVTRVLVPESMTNPHWSLDFDDLTAAFNPLSVEQRNNLLAGRQVQHMDELSTFFAGQQTQSTTAANLLTLAQSVDNAADRRTRFFGQGFLQRLTNAATVVMTTAEAVIGSTAQSAKYLIVTAIDDAGNAWDAVLQTAEDAVDFVTSVIAKIGAGITDLINWTEALFAFDDIRQTAVVISNVLQQIPGVLETVLTQMQSKVDYALDRVKGCFDQALSRIGDDASVNSLTSASKQSSPVDIQTKYMLSMYKTNIEKTNQPLQTSVDPSQTQLAIAFTTGFTDQSTGELQTAIHRSGLISILSSPAGLFGASLADVLRKALQSIIDAAITLAKEVVHSIFAAMGEAIADAFEVAATRINIPYLTAFYEQVVMNGEGEFSLLGLSSLLAAIPFTVAYKLATGNSGPVFTSQEVATISGAGWLNSQYLSSSMYSLLGGLPQQTAASVGGSSVSPSTSSTTSRLSTGSAFTPTTMQKVCGGMGCCFAGTTALWGIVCVIEDTLAIAGDGAPPPVLSPKNLYWAKIVTQALTFASGFPLFTLPSDATPVVGGLGVALYACDWFELCSNFTAEPASAFAADFDPIITGVLGLVQLGVGIAYGKLAGGDRI